MCRRPHKPPGCSCHEIWGVKLLRPLFNIDMKKSFLLLIQALSDFVTTMGQEPNTDILAYSDTV